MVDEPKTGGAKTVTTNEFNVGGDFNVHGDLIQNVHLPVTRDELQEWVNKGISGGFKQQSADQEKIEKLSHELNVTTSAVGHFFKILGENAVPYDQLLERLTEIAAAHKQLVARVGALDTKIAHVRELAAAAEAAIRRGDYASAETSLEQAEGLEVERLRDAEAHAQQALEGLARQRDRVAALHAQRGELRLASLDYPAAASLFGDAADMAQDAGSRLPLLRRKAEALYRLGRDKGDNRALEEAVNLFRRILAAFPATAPRAERGALQMQLGSALRKLGERKTTTDDLDAAIAALEFRVGRSLRTRLRTGPRRSCAWVTRWRSGASARRERRISNRRKPLIATRCAC